MKFGEGFKFVGGMHAGADGVLGEADLGRVVFDVTNAGDRLVLFDLLTLRPQQLRETPPFPGIDQVMAGRLVLGTEFGLGHRILQHADRCDAGGKCRDLRLRVRNLAHVFGDFLSLLSGTMTMLRASAGMFFRLLMILLLFG